MKHPHWYNPQMYAFVTDNLSLSSDSMHSESADIFVVLSEVNYKEGRC